MPSSICVTARGASATIGAGAHRNRVPKNALATQPVTEQFAYVEDSSALVPRRVLDPCPRLGALEAMIVARVDGRRSVEDLAALVSLTPREVLHVLVGLARLGVVDLGTSRASGRSGVRRRSIHVDELIGDHVGAPEEPTSLRDSQARVTLPIVGGARK